MSWERDVQTEAFQGCQAHNSFVCYAIETSCSLLSQYLLPNGMCALLLPVLNNTRLEVGVFTSPLSLSQHTLAIILCPSSSTLFLYLTLPSMSFFPSFTPSCAFSIVSSHPPKTFLPIFCRSTSYLLHQHYTSARLKSSGGNYNEALSVWC